MRTMLFVVAMIQGCFACFASYNPQMPDTTTIAITTTTQVTCPCSLASDAQPLCPGYPAQAGKAVFTVTLRSPTAPSTDPPCTMVFSGCTQYRIVLNGNQCQKDGNPGNPAEGHGPLTCTTGPNFMDSVGNVYTAVDCQTL